MNDLEEYFIHNTGKLIHKWQHYFEVYDLHFSRFRGREVTVVEFGVFQGGSLQMWKHYFGPQAKIYGVDIDPRCKKLEEDQIKIFIGDQEDRNFLRSLPEKIGKIDILIEDGGHRMTQQIATFEELYPHVDPCGLYLCEDLLTSYSKEYGGGYLHPGSFIEYSKKLIDSLHSWHSEEKSQLDVTPFTRSAHSLHFYESILVIEKRPIEQPFHAMTGGLTIPDFYDPQ